MGRCLQEVGKDREKLIIASKCGTRISDSGKYYHDWSLEWMKQRVDISLKRLHIDYLDMLHFFDFVMLDYNIMRQDRETLIQQLYEREIGVIVGAALAQSLYSNRVFRIKGRNDIWCFMRELKNFRGHILEGFNYRFMNDVKEITGNQIALRYVLDNSYITSAVFWTTSQEHLKENVKATELQMLDCIL